MANTETLAESIRNYLESGVDLLLTDDDYRTIIKALEQEPADWIPVCERLPEEDGYYITTTLYREVYCDYWDGETFKRTEIVLAWMPLPEPYRRSEG